MIKVEKLTKSFEKTKALNEVSFNISEGSIYGLVGANGAGKSTLLRILAGVYRPDSGSVEIDGVPQSKPESRERMFFLSDELFFLPGASIKRMAKLYACLYPHFDYDRLHQLTKMLKLDEKKAVQGFSKGMRRQAAIVLALACRPKYLLMDETFDGLDPVMRNAVKAIVLDEVAEGELTVVLSSHSLRELEGVCDQLALLYDGGLVFESDIVDLKTAQMKVQVAFDYDYDKSEFEGMDILQYSQRGTVANFIVRGEQEVILNELRRKHPAILEVLPLSLEEVFIYELEALGYSVAEDMTEE